MPQNVRKGEELDEAQLQHFLHQHQLIDSHEAALNISQFSNGFSNLTYLIQVGDQEYVLRRPPFGAIKRGHDMGREFKVLSNLNQAFKKSPIAYAYTEDSAVIGAPFYVMEKVEGIILTMKEVKKRQVTAPDFAVIANSWLDTFVELHQLDYKSIGLEDLGRPEGYVERQVNNWGKQYLRAATHDIPEAKKVMQWMEESQPKTYAHSLIHNDYKYDNVVFADDQWSAVAAILDWEMCTLGDPLMDLGTSVAYWTMPSDGDFILKSWPSPTSLPGNPGRNELLDRYAQKSGRPVEHRVFYYVYGLFKIAVIVQQIFYRYNKGLTTDERFAHLDKMTQLFMMMAWQAIQKKRIEDLF